MLITVPLGPFVSARCRGGIKTGWRACHPRISLAEPVLLPSTPAAPAGASAPVLSEKVALRAPAHRLNGEASQTLPFLLAWSTRQPPSHCQVAVR